MNNYSITEMKEIFKDVTICGYNFEELVIFAEACRRAGITEQNLHNFCMSCESAFEYIYGKFIEKLDDEIVGENDD